MSALTCFPCLSGKHGYRHCEGDGCACSICTAGKATKPYVRNGGTRRKVQVTKVHAPRKYPKKPGPVPGAHGLKGRSSLDPATQVAVETALKHDWTISTIAREYGISRDRVRTIKQRREALERSKR